MQTKTRTGGPRTRPSRGREERRLTRQCEALRAEIDALTRSRAKLCSALAHDLRNPLAVVMWSSQLLARKAEGDEPVRRHVEMIRRASDEMEHMLSDLSDAARIASGEMRLQRDPAEVSALVDKAVATQRHAAEGKGLKVEVEVAPGLPAVRWDGARLGRVLSGLVANAVRMTPKQGTIAVRAAPGGEGVILSVSDGGAEIPEEQRDALFELPAARERASPIQPPSLLFYVARGVVEAHGGHFQMESAAERGSTYRLVIPAEAEPSAAF